MELRKITLEITIQPKRGASLMETERALRSRISELGYVRELDVTASGPAREPCRACRGGFPLEMDACPSCGRTREPNKPEGATLPFPDEGIRGNVDALAESWRNGNRSTVIKALSVLDGPFAALMAAYLHHEFADEYDRGVFARLLQRACDEHGK